MKREALSNLFVKYYNEALLYACSLCHSKDLAEELVSEAYMRALRSIDEERDGFKFWLFKVMRNLYFDYLRSKKRYAPMPENVSDEDDLVDAVIEDEEYKALYRAIGLLRDNYKEAVQLFYFDGLSVKEIAGILDVTEDSVKVRLFRARAKLKEILEVQYEF